MRMKIISMIMAVLVGVMVFTVFVQIFSPITEDVLFPFINNADNGIEYAEVIITIIGFLPLILAMMIFVLAVIEFT